MNKPFLYPSAGKIMKAFGRWNSLHTSQSLKSNFCLAATFLVAVKDFHVHVLPSQKCSFVASFSSRKIFFLFSSLLIHLSI